MSTRVPLYSGEALGLYSAGDEKQGRGTGGSLHVKEPEPSLV